MMLSDGEEIGLLVTLFGQFLKRGTSCSLKNITVTIT